MEQPREPLANGTAVVTCPGFVSGSTDGLKARQQHLDARSSRTNGKVVGVVPETGAEAYFVEHDTDGETAVYYFTEFELIEENGAANS